MGLSVFLRQHYGGAYGLRDLLGKTQDYNEQIPKKLRTMQEIYLNSNPHLYSAEQRKLLNYYLEAFSYKELFTSWCVEQIWSITRTGNGDRKLLDVLSNLYDNHDKGEEDLLLLSFVLDNFLLQSTAFLDFYMLYLRLFFHVDKTSRLQWNTFRDELRKLANNEDTELSSKARLVLDYFQGKVFGETERRSFSLENWGGIIRNLRNPTVHRDYSFPTFHPAEELTSKITSDWPPELRNIDCARFCEDIQGEMFVMVSALATALYGIEWKPGPYHPELYRA